MLGRFTSWFGSKTLPIKLLVGALLLAASCCILSVPVALLSTPSDQDPEPVAGRAAEIIVESTAELTPEDGPIEPPPSPTATALPTDEPEPTAVLLPTPTNTAQPPATEPPATTAAPPTEAPTQPPLSGELGIVTGITDGDTINVDINGQNFTVRYIGINTPEMGEPCGQDSSVANAQLVMGQTVRLEKDVSETDRFGRLLRYVYIDDLFVNAELVRQGWALAVRYPPDISQAAYLEQQQALANPPECILAIAPPSSGGGSGGGAAADPAPQPTSPPPVAVGGAIAIVRVDKRAEYVDIINNGPDIDLAGWLLRSERGPQDCYLTGLLGAGQTLRIWAMAEDIGQGGLNCGHGSDIWNNSELDRAILFNPAGEVVATFP